MIEENTDDLSTEEVLDFLSLVMDECKSKGIHFEIYSSFLRDCAEEMRELRNQITEFRSNMNDEIGKLQ